MCKDGMDRWIYIHLGNAPKSSSPSNSMIWDMSLLLPLSLLAAPWKIQLAVSSCSSATLQYSCTCAKGQSFDRSRERIQLAIPAVHLHASLLLHASLGCLSKRYKGTRAEVVSPLTVGSNVAIEQTCRLTTCKDIQRYEPRGIASGIHQCSGMFRLCCNASRSDVCVDPKVKLAGGGDT